jgi:hypothetical protein
VSDSRQLIERPDYWKRRLREAQHSGMIHHSIYKCSLEQWHRIAERHRQILAELIQLEDSILDCGCGWGRLLELLPESWRGEYLGVDLSPDFIQLAKRRYLDPPPSAYPLRKIEFGVGDLRHDLPLLVNPKRKITWAVLISIRPMVIRNLGQEAWNEMEAEIRQVASRILYLEYDPEAVQMVE